jgi:hypothetical protein
VAADCAGGIVPQLASSWRGGGAVELSLVLRSGARFWSGDPVTAGRVVASWRATGAETGDRLVLRVADSARVVDERTLVIRLAGITPAWLAGPGFVVAHRTALGFPEGTGPQRFGEADLPGTRDDDIRRFALSPVAGRTPPALPVLSVRGNGARDLIDVGFRTLLTGDPAIARYAASRRGVESTPLEWDRTWLIVVPSRSGAGAVADSSAWHAFRAALARDLVGADARPAASLGALASARVCAPVEQINAGVVHFRERVTIAYRDDDPAARAIAERLVALAGIEARRGAESTPLAAISPVLVGSVTTAAVGLDRRAFATALRDHTEFAFILSVPSRPVSQCADGIPVLSSLPWLTGDDGAVRASTLIPLIETRWRSLVRSPGADQ